MRTRLAYGPVGKSHYDRDKGILARLFVKLLRRDMHGRGRPNADAALGR
jgi:hypothetical protein